MIRQIKIKSRDIIRHSFVIRNEFLAQLTMEHTTAGNVAGAKRVKHLSNNEMCSE